MTEREHVGGTGRMAPESIEHAMLRAVGERLEVDLAPRVLTIVGSGSGSGSGSAGGEGVGGAGLGTGAAGGDGGVRVEVEGIDAAGSVVVQLVPTSGPPKSHHRNKAMADMLKLVWLQRALPSNPRAVLCISEPLLRFFTPASWPSTAARELGVEVLVFRDGRATAP